MVSSCKDQCLLGSDPQIPSRDDAKIGKILHDWTPSRDDTKIGKILHNWTPSRVDTKIGKHFGNLFVLFYILMDMDCVSYS